MAARYAHFPANDRRLGARATETLAEDKFLYPDASKIVV